MVFIKAYAVLLAFFFTPHTQVVNMTQAAKVLDVSVLVRIKGYKQDPFTKEVRRVMGGCSGTYVSNTRILTAGHCFGSIVTGIWVRGNDGKSHPATLVKMSAPNDLALLRVEKIKKHAHAKIANNVRVGEQIINVGSPLMFEFLVSEGIVARLNHLTKKDTLKSTYTITTAMINSGSSGGGAFNKDGELIGVNTMTVGGFGGWAGISMAVDHKTVKEFLNGSL